MKQDEVKNMANILRRRELSLIIVVVAMFSTFADYYLNIPQAKSFATTISTYVIIIIAFGVCLAAAESARRNLQNISKRTSSRWIYSLAALASFLIVLVVGLVFRSSSKQYAWVNAVLIVPGTWGFTGIIIFYVSSACWRVFKMRSVDATILLVTAVLACLSNAPLVALVWPGFISIRSWLDTYVSASVGIAFNMGAAIGGIIFGIRVFLGLERRYMV
jgi:hypothetical protein